MPVNAVYLYVSGTYDATPNSFIPGLSASLNIYSPINKFNYTENAVSDNSGYIYFDLSPISSSILLSANDKYYTDYDFRVYYDTRQEIIATTETSSFIPFSFIKTTRFGSTSAPDLEGINLGTVFIESLPGTVDFQTVYNEYRTVSASYASASAIFRAVTENNQGVILEQRQPYEPQYEFHIVTRLLEYQSGSLGASISYATSASLVTELSLLTELNQLINSYASLYPTVYINVGEGIPYQ
jgi:hypothetical protein